MSSSADVDRDALLCALVLAPFTFARNRFFALFTEPWARRTRSRAAQLRTFVRHFSAQKARVKLRDIVSRDEGGVVLRYGVPHLTLERTATLEPLEIAVIRFALSRRVREASDEIDEAMRLTEEDRRLVEEALAKLGRRLGLDDLGPPAPEPFRSTLNPGESRGER
jgi:hypothetical protein